MALKPVWQTRSGGILWKLPHHESPPLQFSSAHTYTTARKQAETLEIYVLVDGMDCIENDLEIVFIVTGIWMDSIRSREYLGE
jgi:hypothetical protein